MGEALTNDTHPDQAEFPLDISPFKRFESYTAEEVDGMLAELWKRYEQGDDLSDTYYRPIEEFY